MQQRGAEALLTDMNSPRRWTEGVIRENTRSVFPAAFSITWTLHERAGVLMAFPLREMLKLESHVYIDIFENTGGLSSKAHAGYEIKWDFQVPSRHLQTQVGIFV